MDRGALFSDEMVRALLAGRKTQTRRPVEGMPLDAQNVRLIGGMNLKCDAPPESGVASLRFRPPFGVMGDRVYVRETWAPKDDGSARYRADHFTPFAYKWRPSIHMPKRLARLWFDVAGVRVERVASITEDDARAEGIGRSTVGMVERTDVYHVGDAPHAGPGGACSTARDAFRELWDSLYAAKGLGWEANPFVWVYDLRRAEGQP